MWPKRYRDYPQDKPLIQEPLYPGHGIIGCEMHDLNGWDTTTLFHKPSKNRLFNEPPLPEISQEKHL